jgi:hypothetical protein
VSLHERLRNRLHRWMDSDWGDPGGGEGVGPGPGFGPSGSVGEMAEDAEVEGDRPEQEREYEDWQAKQARLGRPTDS